MLTKIAKISVSVHNYEGDQEGDQERLNKRNRTRQTSHKVLKTEIVCCAHLYRIELRSKFMFK